jgi:hypothetical protein
MFSITKFPTKPWFFGKYPQKKKKNLTESHEITNLTLNKRKILKKKEKRKKKKLGWGWLATSFGPF